MNFLDIGAFTELKLFWHQAKRLKHLMRNIRNIVLIIIKLLEIVTKIMTYRGIQNGEEHVLHAKQENVPEGEGAICTM